MVITKDWDIEPCRIMSVTDSRGLIKVTAHGRCSERDQCLHSTNRRQAFKSIVHFIGSRAFDVSGITVETLSTIQAFNPYAAGGSSCQYKMM